MKNRFIFMSSVFGIIAYFIQAYYTISHKLEQGFSFLYSFNHYMSYFTIIINLTVAVLLFFYSVMPNSKVALWFKKASVNGALCLYILIVGIIYYALLFPEIKSVGVELWVGHFMHAYVPLTYLYLWYFQFRNSNLQYSDSFRWLSVPCVYFVYLMIRGQIIGKYPYFFVDVEKFGLVKVLGFAVAILCVFLLVGSLLVFVDQKRPVKTQ